VFSWQDGGRLGLATLVMGAAPAALSRLDQVLLPFDTEDCLLLASEAGDFAIFDGGGRTHGNRAGAKIGVRLQEFGTHAVRQLMRCRMPIGRTRQAKARRDLQAPSGHETQAEPFAADDIDIAGIDLVKTANPVHDVRQASSTFLVSGTAR